MTTHQPGQQTEKRMVFKKCRLGRSELERIFAVAAEGIPADAVVISTQRDDTRFRHRTLEELVDLVQQAQVAGDRTRWTNVQLAAVEGRQRYVTVSADLERAEIHLSGEDATWVYGQAARLELLLKGAGGVAAEKKRKKAPGEIFMLMFISVALFNGLMLAGFVVTAQRPKAGEVATLVAIQVISGILLWGHQRSHRALLHVTAEAPPTAWWRRLTVMELSGLAAAIGGVVAAAAAVASAGADFMK
ncbi:hypothetical protein [Streptomyces smyrnaeus]|uniref:hypothetical protein n=1 Tax=Streptomyces smyrnaeus TaxID=1387713 RepID=UPI0034006EEB